MSSGVQKQSGPTIADVVFAEATPRQRILSWELNGASWASPMTLEEYVGREQALSETALSANGGTVYWVLHLRDDPETVVSACEVTSKQVLVADASGSRVIDAYAVASVFTAPQYRERGMASHMLRKVQEVVDQTKECGALYSDIGRIYYTNLGWVDFHSPQLVIEISLPGTGAPQAGTETVSTPGVSFLSESDVAGLCEKDIASLKQKFEGLAGAKDGKTYLTFLPTFAQCSWHFTRDAYVAKVMAGGRRVEHRGARTADGASWLYWDHDLREKKLKIQRIVTGVSDGRDKKTADIRALLDAAVAEAKSWALPKVVVWEPGTEVSAAATDLWREAEGGSLRLTFEEREDGSIPSLRWKNGDQSRDVAWVDNEYFSWC